MATEPRTVTTHRELTLPPEIVALICAFKPEEGHIGQCLCDKRPNRDYGWPYYECCGGSNYKHRPRLENGRLGRLVTSPCRRFAKGVYHPGKLEEGLDLKEKGGYLRWTCCGKTFGYSEASIDSPPGCTPLDLRARPDGACDDGHAGRTVDGVRRRADGVAPRRRVS